MNGTDVENGVHCKQKNQEIVFCQKEEKENFLFFFFFLSEMKEDREGAQYHSKKGGKNE